MSTRLEASAKFKKDVNIWVDEAIWDIVSTMIRHHGSYFWSFLQYFNQEVT